jgi:hypothetical protein
MPVYVIYAAHAFANAGPSLPEVARTASPEVAEQIAARLRREKFTSKEGVRMKRYSAVLVKQLEDDAESPEPQHA